jgi:hypothetical protein
MVEILKSKKKLTPLLPLAVQKKKINLLECMLSLFIYLKNCAPLFSTYVITNEHCVLKWFRTKTLCKCKSHNQIYLHSM